MEASEVKRSLRTIGIVLAMVSSLHLAGCNRQLGLGGNDWVWNYDFDMGTTSQPSSTKAYTNDKRDWPVTFIFYGPGAEVDRVKSILNAAGADETAPGQMQLPQRDASKAWERDLDGGRKDTLNGVQCPGPINRYNYLHMRVYADPDDDITHTASGAPWYGRVVVGTTHYDKKEHCPDETFGWSEDAAEVWERRIYCRGYSTSETYDADNHHYPDWKSNKPNAWWDSDGLAVKVYVDTSTPSVRC
jgi:hypothetical protein